MTVSRDVIEKVRLENLQSRGRAQRDTPPATLSAQPPARVVLSFPWSMLLPDNHRLTPVVRMVGGRPRPALITTGEYRDAKKAVAESAALQYRGWKFTQPVRLVGTAWFPDERKRDAGNYRKLITDALTGVVYEDDSLVHDDRWVRAGVNRTNPHIVVTVEPMEEK